MKDDLCIPSVLIREGYRYDNRQRCPNSDCVDFSPPAPAEVYVSGFDDLCLIPESVPGFIPSGPPLIGTIDQIEEASRILSGVAPVPVGSLSWNQQQLGESERLRLGGKLKALFVTSTLNNAFDLKGNPLPRCLNCGKLLSCLRDIRSGKSRLDLSAWDGSDLFRLEGTGQDSGIFLTFAGLEKLQSLSLDNLELLPVEWL